MEAIACTSIGASVFWMVVGAFLATIIFLIGFSVLTMIRFD